MVRSSLWFMGQAKRNWKRDRNQEGFCMGAHHAVVRVLWGRNTPHGPHLTINHPRKSTHLAWCHACWTDSKNIYRHVGESAKGLGCLHMSLERHWATAICHPSWLPSQTSAQVFFPRSSDSLDHKMLLVKVESINCLLP